MMTAGVRGSPGVLAWALRNGRMSRKSPEGDRKASLDAPLRRAPPRMRPGRKLLPVLVIFASITVISLALTVTALATQSAVRGYIAGEVNWSMSLRDAVLMLQRYAHTRDHTYLEKFRAAMAVPLGDHVARVELERPDYERSIAVQGFLQGGNHPDDIAGMIRLFRCCSRLPHVQRVLHYWRLGDEHVFRLMGLGERLREEMDSASPAAQPIEALLEQVHAVNDSVRPIEAAFAATLNDVARWISSLLLFVTSAIVLLLIALGAYISSRILGSIRATEEQYEILLNTAGDALIVVDEETGKVTEANQCAEQMIGRERSALIGSDYSGIFEDERARPQDSDDRPQPSRFRKLRAARADAPEVSVEVNDSRTQWGGRPARLAIVRDISERVRTMRELRVASNAMANMAEGVVITDADYRIVSVNRAYSMITGFEAAEVLGSPPHYETVESDDPDLLRRLSRTLRRTGRWQGEVWSRRKNGELYPQSLSVCSVNDDDGKVTHYVALFQDNSAAREHQRRLEHLARHDVLTRLPNRMMFEERSADALARAGDKSVPIALLFIDLDGFKQVNDTFGHVAGDHLLQVVGERLRHGTREGDMIARMGGDEFTILAQSTTPDDAARLAHRLLASLSQPVPFEGKNLAISASIGISVTSGDVDDVTKLLASADAAMYEAKLRGKNNVRFFFVDTATAA